MMIRKADGDGYVNSDHIISMEESNRPCVYGAATNATLTNSMMMRISGEVNDIADRINAPIIPAAPGYSVIETDNNYAENFLYWRSPVVGWLCGYLRVVPVTDNGFATEPKAIIRPDGTVSVPDTTEDYANLAEWEKAARKEWEARAAQKPGVHVSP
jgi:hypothetical protein